MRNVPPLHLRPPARARPSLRWRVAFCAALMNAVQTGAFFMTPTTLMPSIVASLRIPFSLSTVPVAVGKVAYVLLLIPGGLLVDFAGPRRCVLAGLLALALLVTAYATLVRSFAGLVCMHVALAAAASVSGVPVYSIFVAQWFAGGIGLAMGLVLAGFSAAGTVAPAVLGPIEARFGWRAAMGAAAGVLWCVGLPVAYAFLHENHAGKENSVGAGDGEPPQSDELTPLVGHAEGVSAADEVLAVEAEAGEVNKNWTFVGFALSYILLQYCFGCFGENILFFLHTDCRVPLATAALYFSALNFSSFSAKLIGGHLGDRFDRFKIAAFASALAGVGVCVLFVTPLGLDAHYLPHLTGSRATIGVFVVIFGFGYGCVFNCLYALVPIVFGRRRLGATQSALFGLGLAGNAVGSVLTGVLRERYGSYQRPFLVAAVACAANFVVFNITRISLRECVPVLKEVAVAGVPGPAAFERASELDLLRARELAVVQRIGAMSDGDTPRSSPPALVAPSPSERLLAGMRPLRRMPADMARPQSVSALGMSMGVDLALDDEDGLQPCEGFPIARDWSSPNLHLRNVEASGQSGAGASSTHGDGLQRSSTAENIIRSGVISASLEAPGYLGRSVDLHRSFSSFSNLRGNSAARLSRGSPPS